MAPPIGFVTSKVYSSAEAEEPHLYWPYDHSHIKKSQPPHSGILSIAIGTESTSMSSQSVSREIVPGMIWTIAIPFTLFGAKVGGRTSIIKLANGDLFVISPTPIEEGTKEFVDSIGKVKYLAAPNLGVLIPFIIFSDI